MEKQRCAKQVLVKGLGFGRTTQCRNMAVDGGLCSIHSPNGVALRDARKRATFERRQALFNLPFKMAERSERHAKKLAGFLWQLLDGHNDFVHDPQVVGAQKTDCDECKIIKWLKANGYKKP